MFLTAVLRRLPKSGGFIRPVVIIEGLESISGRIDGRERDVVTGALEAWGAVAAVIPQTPVE